MNLIISFQSRLTCSSVFASCFKGVSLHIRKSSKNRSFASLPVAMVAFVHPVSASIMRNSSQIVFQSPAAVVPNNISIAALAHVHFAIAAV
jgi:hypothetical protein